MYVELCAQELRIFCGIKQGEKLLFFPTVVKRGGIGMANVCIAVNTIILNF